MLKVMEHKKWWFGISLLLLIPGIISLAFWQFKPGIEFKGGSLSEYKVENQNSEIKIQNVTDTLKKTFEEEGIKEIHIDTNQESNKEVRFYIKSDKIDADKHANIVRRLKESKPPIEELSFEAVDPQVGRDVTNKAILSIIIAPFAIIGYIAYSFRGVPKPTSSWQFGIFAVIALLHDVLFILGFYSLMGHFAGWEVKAEFVTAALTVMGFSVHDTIVVFDRLRENLKRFPSHSFRQIANMSVAQTMARSLNTSLTVLLVLLAIVLLGGESIRPFTLTLFVGILVGTYSSIFVATPLLDWWQNYSKKIKWPRLSLRSLRSNLPKRRKTAKA